MPKACKLLFATYHPHYKEKLGMTKFAYNFFLFWPLSKLLLLSDTLFNYFIKVIAIYHLNYKDKLIGNLLIIFFIA